MSDQINLFDLFSDTFGEDTVIEEVAPAKEEKNEEKKKPAKKVKADEKIALPVEVYASSWKETISEIDGKTEVTLDELKEYLVNEGYVEIKMISVSVVKEEKGVVVGFSGSPSYAQTPLIGEGATLANGQYTMQLSDADLDGLEKNVGTLAKKWEENNPSFKNAKVIFDISRGVGYPIAGEPIDKVPAGSAQVYYNGAVQEVTLDAETTADELLEKVVGISGGKIYQTEDGIIYPMLVRSTKGNKSSSGSSTKKAAPKPAPEVKYALPVKVVFTVHEDVLLTSENFPEKMEVTEKELIAWLGSNIADEYTEEKTELLLFKSREEGQPDIIEARYKSSKKG